MAANFLSSLGKMPILEDLRGQGGAVRVFLLKSIFFLIVLFIGDRTLAYGLNRGLETYFGLDVPAQVLVVGHSHSVLGIDHLALDQRLGVTVAKYARQGANLRDRLTMIRHYLSVQPDSVRVIVYDVDAHTFNTAGLSANSYRLFFPFMTNELVREHIIEAGAAWDERLLRDLLHSSRYSEVTLALAARGLAGKWQNLKWGTLNVDRLRRQIADGDIRPIKFDPDAIALFEETLRTAEEHGIRVLLAYIPTVDILNEVDPENYQRAVATFESYAAATDFVTFVNFNPQYSHRHELFYDPIHLNAKGQSVVTKDLAEYIRSLLSLL